METNSSDQFNLPKKVAARSRVVFSALIVTLLAAGVTGTYAGVTSGEIQKSVVQPLTAALTYMTTAPESSTDPVATDWPSVPPVVISPSPATKVTTTPVAVKKAPVQYVAPKPACLQYKIREGEFASDKCYSQADYDDLQYYLSAYSTAKNDKDFYAQKAKIDCSNTDFFGQDKCDEAKQKSATAEANIPKYRNTIVSIIARGQ